MYTIFYTFQTPSTTNTTAQTSHIPIATLMTPIHISMDIRYKLWDRERGKVSQPIHCCWLCYWAESSHGDLPCPSL